MIKSFLKKTWLWKIVLSSEVYSRFKNPTRFKQFKEEFTFYKTFLKSHPYKNDLIFDVGANMGRKSFIFLKLTKKVIAFEPSLTLYQFLKKRFEKENIILFNCALGSSVSTLELFVVEDNEAYNSLNKKHIELTATKRGIANKTNVKAIKVQVDMLENFVQRFGLPKYIKIDVEGYEYEVIKGLKTAVPLLSFEVNLPEFRQEAIDTIAYLQTLSSNKYAYNFTSGFSWLYKNFISAPDAVNFLNNTSHTYLEIYARKKN